MYTNRSVEELQRATNTPSYVHVDESVKLSDAIASPVDLKNVKINVGDYAPSVQEKTPAVLTWADLSVTAKLKGSSEPKVLINHVNGTINGGMWAIMGPSGSGKTTFLGVLSQRLDTWKMPITGDIHLNGKPYSKATLKAMSGYVMQDDLIHANLTVHETLMYSAQLRMSRHCTREERENREKEVLDIMGISYTANVLIGDTRNKGISGGERKRVCVAIELMNNPRLLFLDEPTSGLDSTTALSLIKTLRGMADSGMCTVVCTIHQPQTMIYDLMDNLILMKKGNIVYQGSAAKAVDFFSTCGFPCPDRMNPADHFMNVICMDSDPEVARLPKMEPPVDMDFGLDKDDFTPRAVPLWFQQFGTLFMRNMTEKIRRWDIFAMNVLVTIIVSIFIGTGAWKLIGTNQDSIPKRNAILFFCTIHQGVIATLQGIYAFPMERALMLRERQSGSYYVSAYFCGKFLCDMLWQAPIPVLFTCIVYPLTGLALFPASKFFVFMGITFLCSASATSLAGMCCCLFVSIELAAVVLAMLMELTRLYSGFFISPALLLSNTDYYQFKFMDALSYMKYSYVSWCLNEYQDLELTCSAAEIAAKKCLIRSGNDIDTQYGYNQYSIGFCTGMLVIYIVITRFISYLGLRFIKI